MKQPNVYIFIPHGIRTGGPEALFQLSHELKTTGYKGQVKCVFYDPKQVAQFRRFASKGWLRGATEYDFTERTNDVDDYKIYQAEFASVVPDAEDSLIVLPEMLCDFSPSFPRSKVIVWWLSVDYSFGGLAEVNPNHLRNPRVIHVFHCNQGRQFLEALHLPAAGFLSDYSSSVIPIERPAKVPYKVAINASGKVVIDLDQLETLLKAKVPDVQIQRVFRLSQAAVVTCLAESQVFLDLGNFPGKDRLSREASQLDCAIVIAKSGAGANMQDFNLDAKYRVDHWDLESATDRVAELLNDEPARIQNFTGVREKVITERSDFANQVQAIFGPLRAAAPTAIPPRRVTLYPRADWRRHLYRPKPNI